MRRTATFVPFARFALPILAALLIFDALATIGSVAALSGGIAAFPPPRSAVRSPRAAAPVDELYDMAVEARFPPMADAEEGR